MSMGILFELIADVRRWNSDKKVNNYKVEIVLQDVTGKICTEVSTSQKLMVGDII